MDKRFTKSALARAISYSSIPIFGLVSQQSLAQQDDPLFEQIIVTGSRRSANVQEIPLNISAVSGAAIEELRLDGISKIAFYIPGLTVLDRGPRDEVPDVLIRGLNTTEMGPVFNSDTVATYLGEVPLQVDLRPVDLERIEVLKGPQGTLYGQGTMGGAIRYIPRAADPSDGFSMKVRGNGSSNGKSDDFGFDYGATFNVPLVEGLLALRLNVDRIDDPGFIDYDFVVWEAGVSSPEPNLSSSSERQANLHRVADANGEDTLSLRANLRWLPTDWIDANVWYYDQDTKAEGRQISHQLAFGTDRYSSGARFLEPNNYENELLSLEVKADLSFAEATFVYGETEYSEAGQRDQTDLLLNFEYGYEFFPSFSAFTREEVERETDTIELRFASTHSGPISWVAGYFQNELNSDAISEEFTPGFDQFAVDNYGGVQLRPDSLEYIQLTDEYKKETAFYGEIAYNITDSLTATIGYRNYEFKVDTTGGFGLPLFDTVFGGEAQDVKNVDLATNAGSDDGNLYKFNLAWEATLDDLYYFTYSEGYRNGGVNSVPQCTPEQITQNTQTLCALADEVFIDSDTIENWEVGYKGLLMPNISVTAAIYFIDWVDLQVATTTVNGSLPIIGNGSKAESKGLELQGQWYLTPYLNLSWNYAYTDAKLTERAPGLVGSFDALSGTRLPGHARNQGSVNLTYETSLMGSYDMSLNYGIIYSGDVYNIPGGGRDPLVDAENGDSPADFGGEAIPGYNVHHIAATVRGDNWMVQTYVDNLFNEHYITGTFTTRRFLQDEQNGPGRKVGDFTLRRYANFVGTPRNIGVRFTYDF